MPEALKGTSTVVVTAVTWRLPGASTFTPIPKVGSFLPFSTPAIAFDNGHCPKGTKKVIRVGTVKKLPALSIPMGPITLPRVSIGAFGISMSVELQISGRIELDQTFYEYDCV